MNLENGIPDFADRAARSRWLANARSAVLRSAIFDVVNTMEANPHPVHYKVREAIQRARRIAEQESSRS